MRKVEHKLFWIWQLDKELLWINDMADHGYALAKAGRLTFEFDEEKPGKYIYKSLFLKGSSGNPENVKFFRFLEEMGITQICSINYPGTCAVYIRAFKEDYPNGMDIYSDIESRIIYERVLMWYLFGAGLFILFASALNLSIGFGTRSYYAWVNLVEGFGLLVLFIFMVINFIKKAVLISRLKRERAIHE